MQKTSSMSTLMDRPIETARLKHLHTRSASWDVHREAITPVAAQLSTEALIRSGTMVH